MHGRHGGSAGARATALLAGLSGVFLLVGSLFGVVGLVGAVVLSALIHAYAWLASDRIVLRAMRAYPVSEARQPALYRIVRELSTASRLPMPRLYLSPTAAPNAFATGRDPRHAVICCTEGLLDLLDERELRCVLAHEIAHVERRDTLVCSVAAALATGVLSGAQLSWLLSGDGDDDGGGIAGAVMMLVLGPLAAVLLRMAVQRSREYDADVASAALTGDPLGLAAALRALDRRVRELPLRPEPGLRAASALMVVNPFRPDLVGRLFGTHPATTERVARLEALAGYRR